ncbi:hypothetical protein NP233_g9984 [Leucocoprinus birnbaumii]|uniref:DUF6589 domain-containing protein n=1 Tax=Leucocoprinus birnbaumii TaxID=56174 RepID=A0AAD5YSC1_9AGAR|nr:hypothetical protein NP233_g9984 [Leucocoprinus birnbaumii]
MSDPSSSEQEVFKALNTSQSFSFISGNIPETEVDWEDETQVSLPTPTGVLMSTPIVGSPEHIQQIKRCKQGRKLQETHANTKRALQLEEHATIRAAIQGLNDQGIKLGAVIDYIFDPCHHQGNTRWQQVFSRPGTVGRYLDWWTSSGYPETVRADVKGSAKGYMTKLVADEAQNLSNSKILKTPKRIISSNLVQSFSLKGINARLVEMIPVSLQLVLALCESSQGQREHKDRHRERTTNIITCVILTCLGKYSHANNFHKRLFGLYLYSTGAQHQVIEVLSSLGVTESYSNLVTLNTHCTKTKHLIKDAPGTDETAVKSYTGTLNQLTQLEDLNAEVLQQAIPDARPLSISDILLTENEENEFDEYLLFTLLDIIIKHGGPGFNHFEADLVMHQPESKDKIEVHQTPLHPLLSWNIDESTITGNAEVDAAIAGQQDKYEVLDAFVLINGLFHAKIADIHGLLETHFGKPELGVADPGSLCFHNSHLDRLPITLTSLPTFRTLCHLVFVSLYARVLHCLLHVSGEETLENYSSHVTLWDVLVPHAQRILDEYASAATVLDLRYECKQTEEASEKMGSEPDAVGDMVFENGVLFLHDALVSQELTNAVKAGDSGHVVLCLKLWAQSFWGNGHTKYAHEMLHLIHNLTNVWPQKICEIFLNNWLGNPSGNPNSFVELDLIQEHLNYWIKVVFKAHGSNASWEWLEWIAPCIDILCQLARGFHNTLGTDQGTRHAPPDLTKDIQTLMDSLDDYKVYELIPGHVIKGGCPVPDVVSVGYQNLTQGTGKPLQDFNESFQKLQERHQNPPVTEELATEAGVATPSSLINFDPLVAPKLAPSGILSGLEEQDDDGEDSVPRGGPEDVAFDMDVVESRLPVDIEIESDTDDK